MLASRLIGRKRFGLASLLQDYFEFESDKSLQRSDWTDGHSGETAALCPLRYALSARFDAYPRRRTSQG